MIGTVGVLALQGGVEEHVSLLRSIDLEVVQVRKPEELDSIQALFLPGGESTTLIMLLDRWDLTEPLKRMGRDGFPIFGTCAGAVLLSSEIREKERSIDQKSLGLARVRAVRNHFGRQTRSFTRELDVTGLGSPFRGIFIRAPLLYPLSPDIEVLCSVEDGPVMVRQDNLWLCSFHPELTSDARIHKLFLDSLD